MKRRFNMGKKRYAQVETGGRARFFYRAVAKDYGF